MPFLLTPVTRIVRSLIDWGKAAATSSASLCLSKLEWVVNIMVGGCWCGVRQRMVGIVKWNIEFRLSRDEGLADG